MLFSLGIKAQTYSLIIQNKSSCEVKIILEYCTPPQSTDGMVCPALDSEIFTIYGEPEIYIGTFAGVDFPFDGTFDSNCSSVSANPYPDDCYENVGSLTNQTSPTHTDFYVILY